MTAEAVSFVEPGGELRISGPRAPRGAAPKISPLEWSEEPADLCWDACPRLGYRAELRTRRGDWEVVMCAEHAARLEDVAARRGEHRPGQPGEPWMRVVD